MGNCQAIDAATLVIQHPSGKSDKLYWPVCASEIMKTNPGHYVALLISTSFCPTSSSSSASEDAAAANTSGNRAPAAGGANASASAAAAGGSVRVTRIKLLRPTDTLVVGQVYRLITAQEVMKVLSAKKYAKMKKLGHQPESVEKVMGSDMKLDHLLVGKHERQRNHKKTTTTTTTTSSSSSSGTPRPRTWQPSLHSISEAAS